MAKLRVALVGCGDIIGAHIEGFRQAAEQAEIVVCCDTDTARAQAAAERLETSPRIVTDYAEVLQSPDVEAVVLCLPHHLHAPVTMAAAQAGKHILCEKPLAITVADCDQMIASAREAGVVLACTEFMRGSRIAEQAAQWVQEGRLGRLVGMQGTYAHWQREVLNTGWRARPAESGGGHLMDGAIHWIDLLHQIGGTITAVHAMTGQYRPELGPESEDTGVLNFRFEGGHLGQLFACHATRGRGASPMLTVFGTDACLTLEPFGGDHALLLFAPGKEIERSLERSTLRPPYVQLVAEFVQAVQTGSPLRATPEAARENVRVVLAAYESARTGQEVLTKSPSPTHG